MPVAKNRTGTPAGARTCNLSSIAGVATPSTAERLMPAFSKVTPSASARVTPPPPPGRSQRSSRNRLPPSSSVKNAVTSSCRAAIHAVASAR
jgi:hypothetical protein